MLPHRWTRNFSRELEIFRVEAESGALFSTATSPWMNLPSDIAVCFGYSTMTRCFGTRSWGGAQTAAIMTLERIFDHRSPHNLNTLLGLTTRHRTIFSKTALGKRKQGRDPKPPVCLPNYLRTAHEPTAADFRRLADHVKKYRRIYELRYQGLRNQLYAHKQAADPSAIAALLKNTNIREMQRLFTFLLGLHQTLQELFVNGRKPVLRPLRYSAQRISRSTTIPGDSVHERISMHAERALVGILKRRNKRGRQTP